MKHEWRKKEKAIYLPKSKPEVVMVPTYKFLTINGEGNPNEPEFAEFISTLYSVAYMMKMMAKKRPNKPAGHYDYTVYPLEGVWDINDTAKKNFDGTLNKDDLVFTLMIRQPDFFDDAFFQEMLDLTKKKKHNPRLDDLTFAEITEGKCIQMMHLGSYDNEPESFREMEAFAKASNLTRVSKIHREIYLSDFRKVAPEKLKTVLRFNVK